MSSAILSLNSTGKGTDGWRQRLWWAMVICIRARDFAIRVAGKMYGLQFEAADDGDSDASELPDLE